MAVPTLQVSRLMPAPAAPSGIEAAAAGVFHRYLRSIARRTRIRPVDVAGHTMDAAAIRAALTGERPDGRPVVVVYWGADAVAVALLPFLERAFLDAARSREFLFDETFGGRVCAALMQQLGSRYVMLAPPGRPERLEHLGAVMRRGGSYALAVDGGGPYFRVGSGIATLARTLKAFVVPIAAVATRALPWVHRSGISFPLPFGEVRVAIGRPVDGLGGDRHAVVGEIQRSLERLALVVREHEGSRWDARR